MDIRKNRLNTLSEEKHTSYVDLERIKEEHDDGQKLETILEADIIILGISRTSKTPTTIYLANKGYKSANIPMVPNQKIPEEVLKNKETSNTNQK